MSGHSPFGGVVCLQPGVIHASDGLLSTTPWHGWRAAADVALQRTFCIQTMPGRARACGDHVSGLSLLSENVADTCRLDIVILSTQQSCKRHLTGLGESLKDMYVHIYQVLCSRGSSASNSLNPATCYIVDDSHQQ